LIDLTIDSDARERAIQRVRERGIVVPTFAQMKDPARCPPGMLERLATTGLWDLDPANLFRISWKNEPVTKGGGFGGVNRIEFPSSLTGVEARIIALVGRWFPTGTHKVGAAFGCLVPRLVTGQFDPTTQRAVWPSTGNFCRGGAYDSALLACDSVAVLPEEMSRERFEWLEGIAGEVIRTPGGESNVKEIFDRCHELSSNDPDIMVFNQFDEFGNYLWHYEVTGSAMEEVLTEELGPHDVFRGLVATSGSAGTLAAGDYLRQRFADVRIAAGEALQCPTLLRNGFGDHRIEGIGDKLVPWIHNVRHTDLVVALDDDAIVHLARLINEPQGRALLAERGVPPRLVEQLDLLGFSGIANLTLAVRFARYYELGEHDVVLTVLTDSMDLYQSRLREMESELGEYGHTDAAVDLGRYLLGSGTGELEELRHTDRRRIHNLKYFTWVEQQGKEVRELDRQWRDEGYWRAVQGQVEEIDHLIEEFNREVASG
jgi:cysteine synthase